jgi:hypothetical protein
MGVLCIGHGDRPLCLRRTVAFYEVECSVSADCWPGELPLADIASVTGQQLRGMHWLKRLASSQVSRCQPRLKVWLKRIHKMRTFFGGEKLVFRFINQIQNLKLLPQLFMNGN